MNYNKITESQIKNIVIDELNMINERTYKVYHGTNNEFKNFDPKRTPGNIIWFTDSIDSIKNGEHGGQGNKFIMTRYITLNNPAGWAEYDKYGLQQLVDRGYDGVILPHGSEYNDYIVFDKKSIKIRGKEDIVNEVIKEEIGNLNKTITLYHGTCQSNADNLINKGWKPNGGDMGSNMGNPNYLYLSSEPKDALWFAEEKGCDSVVEVKNIPITYLRPDPEDEAGYRMNDLLDRINDTGFPVKFILTQPLDSSYFNEYKIRENLYEQIIGELETLNENYERKLGQSLCNKMGLKYIKVYRAVKHGIDHFYDKDYVTFSERFAKEHAESNHVYSEEPHDVIFALIPTTKLYDAYNPSEYFYSGKPLKGNVIYTSLGAEEFEGFDESYSLIKKL